MYQIYFDNLKVYDKRTSWIMQGFDFDGTSFTGDYTKLGKYDQASAYPYKGFVDEISADDAEKAEYFAQINDEDKMSVADFLKEIDSYLYGINKANNKIDYKNNNFHKNVSAEYDRITFNHQVEELMFAYSDDSGETALNAYKGYIISPDNAEGWSPAFWEGGKELIANSAEFGDGFVVKATEHGLHVMFLVEKYGEGYDYSTLESYLDKEFKRDITKYASWEIFVEGYQPEADEEAEPIIGMLQNWNDWEETDNYLYKVIGSLTNNTIKSENEANKAYLLKKYANDSSRVQRFDEVLKDLI
jgi:uncharacterized lipoprotein YehR (DUF1307 family)